MLSLDQIAGLVQVQVRSQGTMEKRDIIHQVG